MSETFGTVVKRLRESRGLSQSRLAHAAGYDPSTLSRVESSGRNPSRDMVRRLALALELPVEQASNLYLVAGFFQPAAYSSLIAEVEWLRSHLHTIARCCGPLDSQNLDMTAIYELAVEALEDRPS